jgi:hypothetical protein
MATSLRPHHAKFEGDHEEYTIDFISDVKIDNWQRRRGAYFQLLTHIMPFDIPE